MHNPKCPVCDSSLGSRTAFCSDVIPVRVDCEYMIAKIHHNHNYCANLFCKAEWIEFKLSKAKMLKADIKDSRKIKHG